MTREQAIKAYQRTKAIEQERSARLRKEIMVPFFGGCGCRMHNCKVNFEFGVYESPITVRGKVYTHQELAKLSKKFDYEQRKIWDECDRLLTHFAKFF